MASHCSRPCANIVLYPHYPTHVPLNSHDFAPQSLDDGSLPCFENTDAPCDCPFPVGLWSFVLHQFILERPVFERGLDRHTKSPSPPIQCQSCFLLDTQFKKLLAIISNPPISSISKMDAKPHHARPDPTFPQVIRTPFKSTTFALSGVGCDWYIWNEKPFECL